MCEKRLSGEDTTMSDLTNVRAGMTETAGRPGQIAAMRRMLLAFGVGGALGCLTWMAIWLAMQL
ncbi:hypothetical protein CFP71_02695 [Amycolatopsis thailandensis]|uniref:Uncharacterized protein n=2 Tax=Amycolatopsis thailandensis TaxID=589330 RepID=A0A229SI72_9PSEU|nr:hypothetical protein CFP71_02695 [Amycolatopsis thailandensis]